MVFISATGAFNFRIIQSITLTTCYLFVANVRTNDVTRFAFSTGVHIILPNNFIITKATSGERLFLTLLLNQMIFISASFAFNPSVFEKV